MYFISPGLHSVLQIYMYIHRKYICIYTVNVIFLCIISSKKSAFKANDSSCIYCYIQPKIVYWIRRYMFIFDFSSSLIFSTESDVVISGCRGHVWAWPRLRPVAGSSLPTLWGSEVSTLCRRPPSRGQNFWAGQTRS